MQRKEERRNMMQIEIREEDGKSVYSSNISKEYDSDNSLALK